MKWILVFLFCVIGFWTLSEAKFTGCTATDCSCIVALDSRGEIYHINDKGKGEYETYDTQFNVLDGNLNPTVANYTYAKTFTFQKYDREYIYFAFTAEHKNTGVAALFVAKIKLQGEGWPTTPTGSLFIDAIATSPIPVAVNALYANDSNFIIAHPAITGRGQNVRLLNSTGGDTGLAANVTNAEPIFNLARRPDFGEEIISYQTSGLFQVSVTTGNWLQLTISYNLVGTRIISLTSHKTPNNGYIVAGLIVGTIEGTNPWFAEKSSVQIRTFTGPGNVFPSDPVMDMGNLDLVAITYMCHGLYNPTDIAGVILAIVLPISACIIFWVIFGICCYKRRQKKKVKKAEKDAFEMEKEQVRKEKEELEKMKEGLRASTSTTDFTSLTDIQIQEQIGQGQFGEVYRGLWQVTVVVALKCLKRKEFLQEFVAEAGILAKLQHPNIVRFYGIFNDPNHSYLVTEFCSKGSLKSLLETENTNLKTPVLMMMALDCAAGMKYLESQKIVHRDLATRNLLVKLEEGRYVVKVADFGLSRAINSNYYSSSGTTFPIKWTAIEVILYEKYSSKSDVWSFGIVLWEIFSYGVVPYPGKTNDETIQMVKKGERLEKPDDSPIEVYKLMLKCWNEKPTERPDFQALFEEISRLLEEIDPQAKATLTQSNNTLNQQTSTPQQDSYAQVYNS